MKGYHMEPGIDLTQYRYLVIDDDVLVSALVVSMLHKLGVQNVDCAEDGTKALTYMDGSRPMPDIIISDLNMPNLDGIELMRCLAKKQFQGGIVLISSSDQRFLRTSVNLANAFHLNVMGALSKPFTSNALYNLLSSFSGAKEIKPHALLTAEMVTPAILRQAIEAGQIIPYFQPKLDVLTGLVSGVEVLARWQHPEKGIVLPGLFIPVAEEHGLIDLLTRSILQQALAQIAEWHKKGLLLSFAINFSALSLRDAELPNRLAADLHDAGIASSYLILELTESHLLEDVTENIETLLRLRLKGIKLSIDDFGTGHSTMAQLDKIPFSELKIDRMFVNGAARDNQTRVFLQSTAIMAKQLNLSVVAEGIETREDFDVCATMGCDLVQGYFIARPMSGEAFMEWHHHKAGAFSRPAQPLHRIS